MEESPARSFDVRVVGRVRSELTDLEAAPPQGEGAPEAWLVFDDELEPALADLRPGSHAYVLTWLDRADRDVLAVHPRGDRSRLEVGVFSTRSPHRPNPIGLHRVEVVAVNGTSVLVRPLEAVDGTPVVDVKPVLSGEGA